MYAIVSLLFPLNSKRYIAKNIEEKLKKNLKYLWSFFNNNMKSSSFTIYIYKLKEDYFSIQIYEIYFNNHKSEWVNLTIQLNMYKIFSKQD